MPRAPWQWWTLPGTLSQLAPAKVGLLTSIFLLSLSLHTSPSTSPLPLPPPPLPSPFPFPFPLPTSPLPPHLLLTFRPKPQCHPLARPSGNVRGRTHQRQGPPRAAIRRRMPLSRDAAPEAPMAEETPPSGVLEQGGPLF